jgi:hypothetical protein
MDVLFTRGEGTKRITVIALPRLLRLWRNERRSDALVPNLQKVMYNDNRTRFQ